MSKSDPNITGETLLNDFQSVFISDVAVETAKYEAEQSENSMINYLSSYSGGNVLNPQNLPEGTEDGLTRNSLDAHIKKVQADQMQNMSSAQLFELSQKDNKVYKGKRVRVNVIIEGKHPIQSVWLDNRTGYKVGETKMKSVSGRIEEVMLDKNMLVLRPSLVRSFINPQVKNYAIYITDPESLLPMIELKLY